jgi:predicted metal-dependent RNase
VWRRELVHAPGPCVLFATPAMMHGGTSLRVFKQWAPCKDNLVLLPSHCTEGTVGNKLMGGMKKNSGKIIELSKGETVEVRCQVLVLHTWPCKMLQTYTTADRTITETFQLRTTSCPRQSSCT